MSRYAEQLRKILELEQARGYADKAVIGGLDKFLEWISGEIRNSGEDLKLLPYLSPNYKSLGKEARKEWVENVLAWLNKPDSSSLKPAIPLDAPITRVKGISSKLATKFSKLGVNNVRELLYFFPRRHIDYSARRKIAELEIGEEQTILAEVWEVSARETKQGRQVTEAIVADETGTMRVIWFNQPYLAKKLTPGSKIILSGRVSLWRGNKVLQSPEYELVESAELIHTGRLVPIYPLTEGLSQRQVRRLVKENLDLCLPQIEDFLPREIRERNHLLNLAEAIKQAHYPDSEALKAEARRRLAFDELFLIQLGVLARKRRWQEGERAISLDVNSGRLEEFLASLPFKLTSAQKRVLEEIKHDLAQTRPMSRLLQGEVGSGKTVVATAAMLLAVGSGYQAALMAPTEILAEQHYENICKLLSNHSSSLNIGLLIGGMRGKAKQELHRRIKEGEVDILIGTHALIQKEVEFNRLGLVIVDEQHRFGVMQRSQLRQKGVSPHMLVMSATPIPRTLALTIYGDLDISLIDELPPGRKEIKTRWLSPRQRRSAYDFVRQQVAQGHQAFIICPLIEESENIEAKAAVAEYERLSKEVFPDLRLGLLHGRMSTSEKDEVMQKFRAGELDILVSTPVVEVGIDVPNATVVLIEGAERFGLAQLHQFRGRVWRSSYQSYCLLLSETPSPEGRDRLSIMEQTHDGFKLAEEDLRLRGPGEFFGTRQSGLPDLKMARLSDIELLELARSEAIRLFEIDPQLEKPEHKALANEVNQLWQNASDWS